MIKKTVLLTILVSALLSCNDKEVVEEVSESGVNNVTLSIKQSAFTRGVTGEKGASEYAVLGSGKLYFLSGDYTSIFQRQLTPAEVTKLANTTSTSTSNDSVLITGVPSSAKYIYFMANIKTSDGQIFPAVEGTGSADARLRLDLLQGNALNIPMAGLSAAFTNINDNNYRASVAISPIVARIEIEEVTCQNFTPSSPISTDITGYKLSGIFINNINTYVLLSSQPYQNAPVSIASQAGWSSSDVSAYFENNPHFPYFAGGSIPVPSDWTHNAFVDYCSPTNAGLSFYPDVTNGSTTTTPTSTPKPAWAYQVCQAVLFQKIKLHQLPIFPTLFLN